MLHNGGLSQKANTFKDDVVINNATMEDLTLDSIKHACKGSRDKNPVFMMERCSPSRRMVVDLDIFTCIAPTSCHVFIALACYHYCLCVL